MTYALLKWLYGDEKVNAHINMAEYAPHIDPKWDPYSVIYNVKEIQATIFASMLTVSM